MQSKLRGTAAHILSVAVLVAGLTAVAGVASIASTHGIAHATTPPSSVTEFAPNVKWGGRTVAVTVNPSNPDTAIAASESGGLFRTDDGGAHWSHVDGLAQFRMADVEYAPNDATVVLALSFPDTHTVNQGGIWRSTDGGITWSRPDSQTTPCNAAGRGVTRAIAFEPGSNNVFVGTDCGVLRSSDLGATWTAVSLPGQVESLVAQPGGIVDTCGSDGHHRSTDAGQTFSATADLVGGGGCQFGQQVLAASPLESNVLFAAFSNGNVFESDDSGVTWTNLNAPTGSSRPPFVAVQRSATTANAIDVYYSNGLNAYRQTCTGTGGPGLRCATGNGAWTAVTAPHSDLSGFAFTTAHTGSMSDNCALYMAGDGGLMKTTDCGASFAITGANGNGFNALQVYEATGQVHPDHTDLYFGTQDNDIWGSGDNGGTWPGNIRFEGFFLQVPRTSASDSNQTVTGVACSACNNFKSSAHLASGFNTWNNPPGGGGNPFLVSPGTYIQFSQQTPPNTSLFLSTDTGGSWTRKSLTGPAGLVSGGDFTVGLSGRPYVAGPPGDPTIFQAVFKPGNVIGLVKITGFLGSSATVTDISAGLTSIEGFRGGLPSYCDGQGSFICPTVFGVDSTNPLRIIVADADAGNMKQSFDGGNTWVVDNQLTNLVTGNGAFQFGQTVHAIAFDPADPRIVLVGTEANGIIASFDGGQTWSKMIGSDAIPAISSFFFDEVQHDIIVSSYGRGLWKLNLPTADLSVTKTHSPSTGVAGQQLFYTITVHNAGPGGVPQAIVTDTLPPQETFQTTDLTAPAGCTDNGQTVTCDLGAMASGDTVAFTLKVLVNSNTVANAGGPTSVTNTVSVSSPGALDPNLANNTATDTAIIEDSADLGVTKLCKPDTTVQAGQPITCTVFVDNFGPSDARAVVMDDTMLSNGQFTVSNVQTSPPGSPCALSPVTGGQDLTCQLGVVPAATATQAGRATVTYTISANQGQDLNNVAKVSSDTPDPNISNNTATVTLTISSVADLSLNKTAPPTVVAGTGITWTMTAQNNGPSDAAGTTISDLVPAGVHITSVSAPGASCQTGVPGDAQQPSTCAFGTLAAGTTTSTMTINATVDPGTTGILHNDARVSSTTFDSNTSNNLASTNTDVTVQTSLAVSIAATPNPVVAGTPLSYQVTVTNGGPSTATGVVLTDPLPSSLTLTSSQVSGGTGSCGLQTNTNTVQCQLPDLDPGHSVVVFLYTAVSPATPDSPPAINNTATARDANGDSASGGVSTNVITRADLGIVLTSDSQVYKPSTVIHYLITVTNSGPSDAQNVVVTVKLPGPKVGSYVANNAGCPAPSGSTFTCSLGTLHLGQSSSFQLDFLIRGNKRTITSTATVSASTVDPNTANNTSTRVVTVK